MKSCKLNTDDVRLIEECNDINNIKDIVKYVQKEHYYIYVTIHSSNTDYHIIDGELYICHNGYDRNCIDKKLLKLGFKW